VNRWICDILLFCVLLFSVQAMAQENAENREAVMKKQAIADYETKYQS
jgi:lipopolysaccharide export system protein LptC